MRKSLGRWSLVIVILVTTFVPSLTMVAGHTTIAIGAMSCDPDGDGTPDTKFDVKYCQEHPSEDKCQPPQGGGGGDPADYPCWDCND